MRKLLFLLIWTSALIAISSEFIGSQLYLLMKPLTTVLIILTAFLYQNHSYRKYNRLIITALFFCLLGDIFLLKPEFFVCGLGAFAFGHLLFAQAFKSFGPLQKSFKVLGVLFLIGLTVLIVIYDGLGELLLPAIFYIIIIIYMSWMGISFHSNSSHPNSKWIPLAVGLFLFSDILISIDKFKWSSDFLGIPILLTYWVSIFLIANSTSETGILKRE